MFKHLISLLARALVVLSGTALVTFSLLWYAPGDSAQAIAMARYDALLTEEVIAFVRAEAGLDTGFWPAFQSWLWPLLQLNFGKSAVTGQEVWGNLSSAMSYTLPLAASGLLVGLIIALPLGIIAARRPGSLVDRLAIVIASTGMAIPAYWLGLLLILLFTVKLGWLPAMGARTPAHTILPALTLGLGVAAVLTRIIRSGIIEAHAQPFLPALRRRGVSKLGIDRDHIAPHAAIPFITVFGLELAFLLEGTVMVEVIFARPGLGSLLVNALEARDFPVVQAIVVLTALVFVGVNLVVDLVYRIIDPRIGARHA